jgi:hypothetical protein
MKYATEMGPVTVIYVPSFIKIGSGIQNLIKGYTYIQTEWRSHKPTLGKYAKNNKLKRTRFADHLGRLERIGEEMRQKIV